MMVRERTRNVKVSFKVYKVFKGKVDDVSVILTSLPYDMGQGYPFQLEEQYLVFTYLQEGRDHTNLCTRTKPLSEASADIKILDRILRQEPPPTAAVLLKPLGRRGPGEVICVKPAISSNPTSAATGKS